MRFINCILEIEGLSAGYGNQKVLQNINFSVQEGEILGIIGQNGSGKSTLLRCLFSLLKPHEGIINLNGNNITSLLPHEVQRKGISYCLQEGLIFPTLTVEEHLKIVDALEQKTELAFSYFPELKRFMGKPAGNLSGGQRQMLSLCMLLLQDTTLWLMDEPTSGLSVANSKRTLEFLQHVKQNSNKTILLIEHNYDFIFQFVDSVMILKDGHASRKFYQNDFREVDFLKNNLYS
jgi:branched-chain amino acid transport system ATP-binding protein